MVLSEIDGIERFPSAKKLVAMPVRVLPPTAAGARSFKANCYNIATNDSAGPLSRPPRLLLAARPTSATSTNTSERLAISPASPSSATAHLIARITWQLLTQRRPYTSLAQDPIPSKPAYRADRLHGGFARKCANCSKIRPIPSKKTSQPLQSHAGWSRSRQALMTHPLIGWRAGDLIVITGRGPAWPAPQRSVVPVSP